MLGKQKILLLLCAPSVSIFFLHCETITYAIWLCGPKSSVLHEFRKCQKSPRKQSRSISPGLRNISTAPALVSTFTSVHCSCPYYKPNQWCLASFWKMAVPNDTNISTLVILRTERLLIPEWGKLMTSPARLWSDFLLLWYMNTIECKHRAYLFAEWLPNTSYISIMS